MKKSNFYLFLILSVCLLLTACEVHYPAKKSPKAVKGILDLSDWDFKKDGTVKLNGQWEFYREQLLPDNFKNGAMLKKAEFLKVPPGLWNIYVLNENKFTGNGNATFRLTIKIKDKDESYGLKFLHLGTAYQLWVNKKLEFFCFNGKTWKTGRTLIPQYLPRIVTFRPESRSVQIVLYIPNFSYRKGCFAHTIEIGTEHHVLRKRDFKLAFDLFLFGTLVTLALYHLCIFALRRKNISALYFGCLCVLSAFLYMMSAEGFFIALPPNLDWQNAVKIEFICIYLGFAIFLMLIRSLYPKEFSQTMLRVSQGLCVLFALLTVVPNPGIYYTKIDINTCGMASCGVIVPVFSIYLIYVLIRAGLRKREGAIWLLAAFSFFSITIINDILCDQGIIYTGQFGPFGLLIFILAQSFILSLHFSKSLARMEHQTSTLAHFVPKEFLRELNKEDIADVKLGDQAQTTMSILFSDIRDFTALSETMTPDQTFKFINSYLKTMGPVVRKHHGFIDKYIGDAIMALFDKSADDAVRGAIDMLRKLAGYNEGRKRAGYDPVRIGIGINTGPMIIGTIGESDRMEGTVISDAVNVASRIEDMTKIYGVSLLISKQTYFSLKNPLKYNIRRIDRVKVKGKEESISLWEVFDADPPDILKYKLDIAPIFAEAVSLYLSKQYREAEDLFLNCLARNPRDQIAALYRKRCQLHMKMGDSEKWGGIVRHITYEILNE